MLVTMTWIALVILLALVECIAFSFLVGGARKRYNIPAPAIIGNPDFERTFRVHYNTIEHLIVFIPAIWLFGLYLNPRWGALIGAVFLIGRALFAAGYIRAAEQRSMGAILSFLSMAALVIGALFGVIRVLLIVPQ